MFHPKAALLVSLLFTPKAKFLPVPLDENADRFQRSSGHLQIITCPLISLVKLLKNYLISIIIFSSSV